MRMVLLYFTNNEQSMPHINMQAYCTWDIVRSNKKKKDESDEDTRKLLSSLPSDLEDSALDQPSISLVHSNPAVDFDVPTLKPQHNIRRAEVL